MKLVELIAREAPAPWQDGGKIPWDDPAFSARMLREHLDQGHDRASRRLASIERHVAWLHAHVLSARPARVLDLGCGPGLYTQRLARLGHRCVGIDFSPASIAHARAEAAREQLACEYHLADLRAGDFGSGFDAILLLSGELNTFAPAEARALLAAARSALNPSATLVLEVHRESHVRALGARPASWFSALRSVFSDAPHLVLRESFWHEPERAATERWLVHEAGSDDWRTYLSTTQAYPGDDYAPILEGVGFEAVTGYASLDPDARDPADGLLALVARRRESFIVWTQPIARVDDALRLVEAAIEQGTRAILLDGGSLPVAFFDLRTRFAGEFVQKLVNYQLRVAAVFPPDGSRGERFREFIGELRRGSAFRTFESRAEAEAWLASS